jgi:hypothetical protein
MFAQFDRLAVGDFVTSVGQTRRMIVVDVSQNGWWVTTSWRLISGVVKEQYPPAFLHVSQ